MPFISSFISYYLLVSAKIYFLRFMNYTYLVSNVAFHLRYPYSVGTAIEFSISSILHCNGQWDINKYIVTFESKQVTAVESQAVTEGGRSTPQDKVTSLQDGIPIKLSLIMHGISIQR